MAIAVQAVPASGSIIDKTTALRVTCTGAASNTLTGYDVTKYPTSPQVVYYFSIEKSGQNSLVSPRFAVSSDGKAEWHTPIIPTAGTWSLVLRANADDSSVASTSLVVS